jgi:PAS domain-containing protein
MVKYLGVNQGGLFVLNEAGREEEKLLEMTACYAFDRKKFAEKQIHPGEGLVGTCYLEGATIYMTDIPNEYITITSGLGDANPRAVLICPLKVNDEIFGVIELASFHPFEPYQLDFVQKVSESIAATISSVRVNIRTERLLAQTQQQTEEMANQEEELRQNMEEMQATQEDMRRREAELNKTVMQMKEIQESSEEKEHEMRQFYQTICDACNVVELSANGVITNVNQNLINIFHGADRNTFIGKTAASFIGEEVATVAWENLVQGKYFENVQTVDVGVDTRLIRHKFMPICNKQGKLLRVFLLISLENEG